jgi:hypothetical protein
MFRAKEDSAVSNKHELEAQLQGIEATLDELENEYGRGKIDLGRYLDLKKVLETDKAKLKKDLDSLVVPPTPSLEKESSPTLHSSPSQADPTAKEPIREPSRSLWDRFKRWLPIAIIGLAAVLIIVYLQFADGDDDQKPTPTPTNTLAAVTSTIHPSTDTPRLTFTPTPNLTFTPIPTLSPSPISYSAPVLEEVSIVRCNVIFRWRWDGVLAEDECFEVRVGKGPEQPGAKACIKEQMYTYPLREADDYSWEIAICRGDSTHDGCGQQLAVSEFNETISVFELREDCDSN